MKRLKTLFCFIWAAVFCSGAVGCASKTDSTKTKIQVLAYEGGFGWKWLEDSAARFEQENAETSFEEGKKGVIVEVKATKDTSVNTMNSSAVDVYFTNGAIPRDFSQRQLLADINDVVTEKAEERDGVKYSIEDKIDEDYRVILKNRGDGHYYGLPYADYYYGLSYDKEAFDAKKLYFAAPDATGKTLYESPYGSAYFLTEENASSKKSCGVDGKYGTSDDGLPTSIKEFMILCSKLKQSGYSCIGFPGGHVNYANQLLPALWSSLAGYDAMRSNYDYSGEIEVVTGYSDAPLFEGISYIKKPETKKVTLSEAEGYYSTQTVERYYALAFMEACENEGWFANISTNPNVSNINAMGRFLTNGLTDEEKVAMLLDGSFWYNEASDYGEVNKYNVLYEKQTGVKNHIREIGWMPLPVSLDESVEPRNDGGRNKYTFTQTGNFFAVVNARAQSKGEGVLNASKKFLQFTYSDEELSKRTGRHGVFCTGLTHPVADEDYAKLNYFQKSVVEMAENANLLVPTANNETFLYSRTSLAAGGSRYYMIKDSANREYSTIMGAMRNGGYNAMQIMDFSKIDESGWGAYYKG